MQVFMYVCIYVCMYTHMFVHVCVLIYICLCVHVHAYVCMHVFTWAHMRACAHTHVCVCVAQVSSSCAFLPHVLSTTQLYFTKWLSYLGKKFCYQYCMCMCQLPLHHANDLQNVMCHEHDFEFYLHTCNCFNISLHILPYYMVQSPSWEANWFAAIKKFPAFHGTRRFITALIRVHQLSLSWASPIQSIYPHPTY